MFCLYEESRVNLAESSDCGKGGGSSGVSVTQRPTLSGLFAGGFPVLKPVGQREKSLPSRPGRRVSIHLLIATLYIKDLETQGLDSRFKSLHVSLNNY